MNETTALLMRLMEENWLHARQSEEKRATLAIAVLVIASASQITFTGFSTKVFPLSLFVSLLGIYAIVCCLKLYERQVFHTYRAKRLRARLDELHPEAQAEHLLKVAETEHNAIHPFAHIRLHHIWLWLYTLIIVLSLAETVLCFVSLQ